MTRVTLLRLIPVLCAITLGVAPVSQAQRGGPSASREILELNQQLNDPATAFEAVRKAQRLLKGHPDSLIRAFLHRGIVTGMMVGKAPGYMLAEAADSALLAFRNEPLQQVAINGQVAQYLVNHADMPKRAQRMASAALKGLPNDERYSEFRAMAMGVLGEAYLLNGKPDSAILVLSAALPASPDSQKVLARLGAAYARQNKNDLAINAFSRSLGVYLGTDTTSAPVLRSLWIKKHGSLKGMDEHVARYAEASKKSVALDARRYERTAPTWTLPDLDGKSYRLEDHRGKVVVLDFWGEW
jgi:tetratricopeptide (TPR) repeat protein